MKTMRIAPALLALWWSAAPAAAQAPPSLPPEPPAPPANLQAADHPWDNATNIDLTWDLSPDDGSIEHYRISTATATVGGASIDEPKFRIVAEARPGTNELTVGDLRHVVDIYGAEELLGDSPGLQTLRDSGEDSFEVGHLFRVTAVAPGDIESSPASTVEPIVPRMEWFHGGRLPLLIITIIFCGAVVFWIAQARTGRPVAVRKIAGLEAVDEAVGRATEMGRSVLFIPGIQDMNDIQTIAGITVLARVANTAAEYDARVEVPTSKSLVMTACRETVQAAFMEAGRPDAYNEDLIYYVTDEQFGYVAYLQGMMVREKPAACFYMGHFFAESLILAETGNAVGAIQVAGTAAPAQLPFFVAACDYTLIGEEFFAASAYLSGEPDQLGSLKGQDVGKVIVAVILVLGVALATAAGLLIAGNMTRIGETLESIVRLLREVILT